MRIHHTEIKPGEHVVVRLPAPKLYNLTQFSLPVHVIRGKEPGPTLCVTAALHGDEVNGIEIIRRLLKKSFLHSLAGTLIAVPAVNIYGLLFEDRYLPDRRDLNRSFPGSERGSLASRFAHLLSHAIFSKATHFIDLHTGSLKRTNFPQIRIDLSSPHVAELAHAFNAPVILSAPLRPGSFREYAKQRSIPYLLYEAGEAARFDEHCIRVGVSGILGVMHHLKMIHSSRVAPRHPNQSTIARTSYWVRSPYGGVFIAKKALGVYIEKGDVLGIVVHPTESEEHTIVSPIAGMIIGRSDAPLVHEGAGLFHIACFEKSDIKPYNVEWLQELNDTDKEEDGSLDTQFDT